jgi:hypothetical protein
MSLVIVTEADPLLELSAELVACTLTSDGTGKSGGAVYTPLELIVPTAAFPPGIPFTLQSTVTLEALVTAAVNGCEFPSNTGTEEGVTLTVMPGGSRGGFELASPPQPSKDAAKNNPEPLRRKFGTTLEGLHEIDPPCMPRRFARPVPVWSTRDFVLALGSGARQLDAGQVAEERGVNSHSVSDRLREAGLVQVHRYRNFCDREVQNGTRGLRLIQFGTVANRASRLELETVVCPRTEGHSFAKMGRIAYDLICPLA